MPESFRASLTQSGAPPCRHTDLTRALTLHGIIMNQAGQEKQMQELSRETWLAHTAWWHILTIGRSGRAHLGIMPVHKAADKSWETAFMQSFSHTPSQGLHACMFGQCPHFLCPRLAKL